MIWGWGYGWDMVVWLGLGIWLGYSGMAGIGDMVCIWGIRGFIALLAVGGGGLAEEAHGALEGFGGVGAGGYGGG